MKRLRLQAAAKPTEKNEGTEGRPGSSEER